MGFLLRALLALLAARWVVRLFSRPSGPARPRGFARSGGSTREVSPDLSDLTPWEIEDAEYEELPPKKG